MNKFLTLALTALTCSLPAAADMIYLNSGQQYYGHLMGEREARLGFQTNQGVQMNFPFHDLQSISFSQAGVTVVLHNGQSYFGEVQGPQANTIDWMDRQGVAYHFPTYEVSSISFTDWQGPYAGHHEGILLPAGSEITVLTNLPIDSRTAQPGQTFPAQITQDVTTPDGRVVIPRNSDATLVLTAEHGGGFHNGDVVLDLDSVTINGVPQSVVTSDVVESAPGHPHHTGAFIGGGAILGGLIGAIAGGGRGAAIGAAAGAGAGAVAALSTHGKHVYVPAESTLTFELDRPVLFRPRM